MNKHNGSTFNSDHYRFHRTTPHDQRNIPFHHPQSLTSRTVKASLVVLAVLWCALAYCNLFHGV